MVMRKQAVFVVACMAFNLFSQSIAFAAPHENPSHAGARANWSRLSSELSKPNPDSRKVRKSLNKTVFLTGSSSPDRSTAGLSLNTDSGVTCIVLNPTRIVRDNPEAILSVLGKVRSIDILRKTVTVRAVDVKLLD